MNPLTDLSPYSLVVLLITLSLAIGHQIQATGKLLGQWDVPPKVVAYVLFVMPFVAGAGASLADAHVLTTLSIVNALITGVRDVVAGAAPGVAVSLAMHAHVTVPQKMAAMRAANTNAAAVAAKAATTILMLVGMGALMHGTTACIPAAAANDIAIGLEGATCALDVGSADTGAGKSWQDTIADVVAQCGKYGIDEGKATGLLQAHRRAEIKEGLVPKSN